MKQQKNSKMKYNLLKHKRLALPTYPLCQFYSTRTADCFLIMQVQLQHKIKQEAEQFRQWKASREKELLQVLYLQDHDFIYIHVHFWFANLFEVESINRRGVQQKF